MHSDPGDNPHVSWRAVSPLSIDNNFKSLFGIKQTLPFGHQVFGSLGNFDVGVLSQTVYVPPNIRAFENVVRHR